MPELTPRPYQIEGRDFLASRTRALLADEMRVGKSCQAILAADRNDLLKALVLCPAIAVEHWKREWTKWAPEAWTMIDIMSYDKARNLWQAGDLKAERWDAMIVDEAHFCKNPEAARTQMVYGRRGLGYQCGAIWALSGTPAPKHAGELWPMLRAFGVTDLTYPAFIAMYCTGYRDRYRGEFVITGTREDGIPALRALLATCMLRRTRKQVAPEMPEIGFEFLEVDGKPDTSLQVPVNLSDEALLAWLEANSSADSTDRQAVALAKVPALVDEIAFNIDNGLLKQTVVFGWHKLPLETLRDELVERGITALTVTGDTPPNRREATQQIFRAGSLQVVVANILAAGTAIDLSAASHAYVLEMDWVPGNNMQAVNRLVSMEKQEPVTVDVVTWPGSTDDRVQRVLMRRVKEINQLI